MPTEFFTYTRPLFLTHTLSLPLTNSTLRVRVRVYVCVCIDSSLHALSMSSLVDSLASVGISRLRALPASRFYYFYFFFFVNLFLSYIFFSLRASLYLSLFLPILFISKSGAPVHVRIFSCSFTPLKRPPRDIQKMYKLIYFYLVSVIVTTIFLPSCRRPSFLFFFLD